MSRGGWLVCRSLTWGRGISAALDRTVGSFKISASQR